MQVVCQAASSTSTTTATGGRQSSGTGSTSSASSSGGGSSRGAASVNRQQAALNDSIKGAGSCGQVLQLVRGSPWRSITVLSTAANTMARLHLDCVQHGGPQAQLAANRAAFRRLVQLAFLRLEAFKAWPCAQYLWASAKLQEPLSPGQLRAWEQQAQAQLQDAKPQHTSTIIVALATLGQPPSSGAFMSALRQGLLRALQQGEPQAVANSLWGWAKLGMSVEGGLAEAAAAAVQRTAGGMNPQEVSNSLWGWAKLGQGLPLGGGLAEAAAAAVQRTADGMTLLGVSNTIHAFARGGWQLDDATEVALQAALLRALERGRPQHVANCLWGWSKLHVPLGSSLQGAAVAAVLRTLPQMKAVEVYQIELAFSSGVPGFQLSGDAAAALAAALEGAKEA